MQTRRWFDWRHIVGVALGLGLAAGALAWRNASENRRVPVGVDSGRLISECDGAIREIAIQYTLDSAPIVETVYREFLRAIPADVTIHAMCPDREAFDDLRGRLDEASARRLNPIFTGHAMSCWSRDRWLALERGEEAVLVAPAAEEGAAMWPQRRGDERMAQDLAEALGPRVRWWRSDLFFDGGDFAADSEAAFVTPRAAARNLGRATAPDAKMLNIVLSQRLGRRIVLLDEAPPHHAGMYMMLAQRRVAKERVAVVGDPSMARRLLDTEPKPQVPLERLIPHPEFSPETQRLFDSVAERCRAEGYRVVRIPTVMDRDGRTFLTYTNVIQDDRLGVRTVYMPIFQGAETLNKAAEEIWRGMGYRVARVDCTNAYRNFGALHCLVNVVRRS